MIIFLQWTSSDFGLDSQGKCRASSPCDETMTEASDRPEVQMFKKIRTGNGRTCLCCDVLFVICCSWAIFFLVVINGSLKIRQTG